jgi:CRISPR-associated exonuclease Cas4
MNTNLLILLASLLLLTLALLSWLAARRLSKKVGIPEGRIIYSDPGTWKKNTRALYDAALGLTGKPDYLIKQNGVIIPAEVKSGYAPRSPYDSHVMQLAAYCLLVETTFGARPPYAILRYRNRTFKLPFTPELEEEVCGLITEIRRCKTRDDIPRSHENPARCGSCGYRQVCDQRL